jgi:hypothetical protein
MDDLKATFLFWLAYAEGNQPVNAMHVPYVEQWARTHQPKISAITYRPPNTPAHVVPARIMALLLTALEAIAIHKENFIADLKHPPQYVDKDGRVVFTDTTKTQEDYVRRVNDQKALIRGYLRQLRPFIFEESTPPASQAPHAQANLCNAQDESEHGADAETRVQYQL